ncbi:hypothetical protein QWZ04_14035 [Vibrio tapetis subsp. quintayensis]|uniref:hypothetical protein n=1 Tax=Vibrio tapetis TaxID=52443 RepID=UPI0025B3337C|nr:hypothetical protein [Vibrio tapetis]MDN3681443.1 hypothetical protein [Vibrio tapetis subsp. quintayensis]
MHTRIQHRRVLWSLMLVGLTILGCLSHTINALSNSAPQASISTVFTIPLLSTVQNTNQHDEMSHIAVSPITVSNTGVDKAESTPTLCEKSQQLLNLASPHSDGSVDFLLFAFLIIVAAVKSLQPTTLKLTSDIPQKNRIHITHCVFRE